MCVCGGRVIDDLMKLMLLVEGGCICVCVCVGVIDDLMKLMLLVEGGCICVCVGGGGEL